MMRPRPADQLPGDGGGRRIASGGAQRSLLALAAVVSALAAIAVGCGGSSSSSTTSAASSSSTATTSATATSATTSTTAAGGSDLSGTWNGQYSGTYQGTFVLKWQQSGSKLSGSIDLSTDGTPSVNGTLQGSAIQFGTVGSNAITYTGSVSGNSMSGSYQAPGGGGSWSANKG